MAAVEVVYDFGGSLENFGAFDRGLRNGNLAMRATDVEGEGDLRFLVIPIESVFHFITVVIVLVISEDFGGGDIYLVFAEKFNNQCLLKFQFVVVIYDLPRGSGEIASVVGLDAKRGRFSYFGGDGLDEVGFSFSDIVSFNYFTWESVPEENLFTVV